MDEHFQQKNFLQKNILIILKKVRGNIKINYEQGTQEQGTRNKEQGTRNKEQGTRNKEQGTRNKEF